MALEPLFKYERLWGVGAQIRDNEREAANEKSRVNVTFSARKRPSSGKRNSCTL